MPYTPFSKAFPPPERREPDEQPEESADFQMAEIRKALQAAQEAEDVQNIQKWTSKHNNNHSDSNNNKNNHATNISTTSTTPTTTTKNKTTTTARDTIPPPQEQTAYYNEGGTELFRSIEQCDWETAFDLLQQQPQQARIWVVSTGTVDTTFNWSLWKRLPIHEAARRQCPVLFMTKLIETYPESCRATTHFGETVLHLAVECGCQPAVIYLLCVHHWRALFSTDQSGRTPRDVLQEAALLDPSDQTAVVQALEASQQCYRCLQQEHKLELQSLKELHQRGITAIRNQHDDDLRVEQTAQDKLLEEIRVLRKANEEKTQALKVQQAQLQQLLTKDEQWQRTTNDLQQQVQTLTATCQHERTSVASLVQTVAGRDAQAAALCEQIVDLQTALSRIQTFHANTVQRQLSTARRQMEASVKEFTKLSRTLVDHQEDLQTLLQDIDVSTTQDETTTTTTSSNVVLVTPSSKSVESTSNNNNNSDEQNEEDMMDEEAMLRAARAASNVL